MRSIRYGVLTTLATVLGFAAQASAQSQLGSVLGSGPGFGGVSSEGLTDAGGLPGLDGRLNVFTAPLGDPGKPGPFVFADVMWIHQGWTMGNQTVAYRGLVDTTGQLTQVPGTYIGSGVKALETNDLTRNSWMPGINVGVGWKMDDGTTFTARILRTHSASTSAGASLATQYARSNFSLTDTFLTSGVFNFPPQFAGPGRKTAFEGSTLLPPGYSQGASTITPPIFILPGGYVVTIGSVTIPGYTVGAKTLPDGLFYGIWNGASNMVIAHKRWFTEAEIGGRVPLFESNSSKIYGLGGVRHYAFDERFRWRTESYGVDGSLTPQGVADYDNTLRQNMYGPYVGCSHEMYLHNNFSVSTDLSATGLINFVSGRAKYQLGDDSVANKAHYRDTKLVPNVNANVNVWWYPVKGVQVRVGYMAETFFNTARMKEPISFNYGGLDPTYGTSYFNLVHGLNIGVGVFF